MVRELEKEEGLGPDENSRSRGENDLLRYLVGLLCVGSILVYSVSFSVREGRQAVVLRFGEPVRITTQAGLQFKAPWPIERIIEVDTRRRSISTPQTELLTRDKKNIVLMTGGAWYPSDPVQFHRALGSIENGDDKVTGLVINAKIAVFGRYDLSALASTDPEKLQTYKVEQDVLEEVNRIASAKYGIEVSQVGFRRLSLPERNIAFVLDQMRAERRQFAAQFRADGELEAARIRNRADLEAANIIATAEEEAARTMGKGIAQAARISAEAYNQDPDFYRFVRSLDALENSLGPTTAVTLRTDSAPFDLLVHQPNLTRGVEDEAVPIDSVGESAVADNQPVKSETSR